MGDITKIKVDGEPESSYQLYPRNEEFAKRGVQPDWNQNDDTQPDYVKNRPFYDEDVAETVLLEESILSFINPEGGYYYASIPTTIELTVGETYKVSWDGATYECVCESIRWGSVIGNPSIMGAGEDTGDPFLISPLANDNGTEFYTRDASASHIISISTFASAEVVKIPDKYISDTFRHIVTAGNPLQWSKDDWAAYYGLFQGGKLLKINAVGGLDRVGYVLSMYYDARTEITKMTTIDGNAGLYYLSINDTTNERYWTPVFKSDSLYLRYIQTGSDIDTSHREEYAMLDVSNGLTFKTKKANENVFKRKVVLEGDKGIVLSSSTTNSTKKFKITVDDSGALTATEVT